VGAIVAEATSLREFFAQQCPALGRELGPVTLEPEAPERVRAFWETFGWTDELEEDGWLSRPEVPASRETVRELLEEMREDDVELQGELPQRYRLVNVDRDGIGFAVTNEEGDPADPPVVAVISDTGAVVPEHSSYLNFCANKLVRKCFLGWHTLRVDFSNYAFAAAAEAPWPLLSPATRRLAPDVWLVPNYELVVEPGPDCHIAYARVEALTRWLMGLPEDQTLEVGVLPWGAFRIKSFAPVEALLEPGARSFPGTSPGERIVVGTIEGRPVLAWQLPARCEVLTEPSQTEWLCERLRAVSESSDEASSATTGEPIRDEDLAALDELVAELCPHHRVTRRPIELEPDAPERMRRLWAVLGHSHATAKLRPLTRAESRAALEQIFADWYAEPRSRSVWAPEGGPEAYFAALPERCRLLRPGRDEIDLTDETGAVDDPPVLVMRKRRPPIITERRSYVEWLIWELVTTVTRSRWARYDGHSGIRGERLVPSLYPTLERLGEGVYRIRMPEHLRTDSIPAYPDVVVYPTLGHYFRWVLALPDEQLRFVNAPEAMTFEVRLPGAWDLTEAAPDGFRRFHPMDNGRVREDFWEAVGQIGDVYLWLFMSARSDELFVSFDPRKEDEVRAILAAHNLRIKHVDRIREDYDEYGW
jgi:hypothetical protein